MRRPLRRRGATGPTTGDSRIAVASLTALAAALAVAPLATAAADATARALRADAFVARFERDNPRFAAVDADADAHRADATAASQLPNPSLSFEREQVFPDYGDAAENALVLGWSLDLSGRRARLTRAAHAAAKAAQARADGDKLAALVAALDAFYDTAYARLRVQTLRDGRAPLARMVDAIAARVEEGDAAGYDLARLELELAAYDEGIAAAETELRAAQRTLGGLVGEPAALYDADDELALPSAPPSADELARDALSHRSDARALKLDQASANAAQAAARRAWVPSLDLQLGLKTADVGTDTATGYIAVIGVELPLFSRGQADSERAAARRRAARARRAQLERDIPTAVRIARDRLAAAIDQATTFRVEQLDRASALVAKAEAIYNGGEASVVELVDAYRTAVDARLRYLSLLRRAKSAELALSLALGRRPTL